MKDHSPVVVTTEFRGVFFGYMPDDAREAAKSGRPEQITLTDCRNCIRWASSIGGFLGLASVGPNQDCLIGKTADLVTLYKITSVTDATKEAVSAWSK